MNQAVSESGAVLDVIVVGAGQAGLATGYFLQEAGVPAAGLYEEARAWRGVTWGLVEAFKVWQLQQGYAIGSINGRLSTVRTFARLAAKAGVPPAAHGRTNGKSPPA